MQELSHLPNKSNAFSNFIPTRCKKNLHLDIVDDNNSIINDQTHVLIKHNNDIEGPIKRKIETEDHAPRIRQTKRVKSIQTDLIY
ncbi:hypothetical protein KM1_121220 [Entamoeba histolytica HM-3:IMSS]|uniref:Uncharacterized protein n=2 Tax=Entamoeba histolytica TaxID=5759 RepID=A0A175K062_ENTHI|nr:hypothetical protein KM1_121220 [Entamoeba histolytica HM-3:IMSS]GAT99085.1 hypothetical protein CL6EHI_c00153 [Entamoeba histolytica]